MTDYAELDLLTAKDQDDFWDGILEFQPAVEQELLNSLYQELEAKNQEILRLNTQMNELFALAYPNVSVSVIHGDDMAAFIRAHLAK